MATLLFKGINKIYDNKVQAVFDFNLEVKDKEFIVFVGPSGCGKSTTLRMIAGLEEITSGELYIDDKLINDVAPKDRDIAMVFQNYALYPHMTVYDNMAFALKLRKFPRAEIDARVNVAAEKLGITPYLKRKPKALSGGQRQRVALGRAIVREPKVFLMDEPLSNLDAKLRVQMRTEIAKIHESVGATTIYVTHDQTEAMTMASRIVVMKDGYIQQIGAPKEIYRNPANMFVAGFIGSPAMNFITGTYSNGVFTVKDGAADGDFSIKVGKDFEKKLAAYEGKEVVFGVRPEDVTLEGDPNNEKPSDSFKMECDVSELLGHELIVYGFIGNQRLIVKTSSRNEVGSKDVNKYTVNLKNVHFFDKETELRIDVEDAPKAEAAPAKEESAAE